MSILNPRLLVLLAVVALGAVVATACSGSPATQATNESLQRTIDQQQQQIAALQTSVAKATQNPPAASGSPTQVAEGFLKAAMQRDLAGASRYFAPDRQPKSWDGVFKGPFASNSTGVATDITECQTAQYTSTERPQTVTLSSVVFAFANSCISYVLPFSGSRGSSNQLTVTLEQANSRWWIARASALGG